MITEKIVIASICGIPNVGKSSILNKLISYNIVPVSSKPQTTRYSVHGILNRDDVQIVFVDTPGIFIKNSRSILERKIVKNAWSNVKSNKVAILVLDPKIGIDKDTKVIIDELVKNSINIIFFINKSDIKKNNPRIVVLVHEIAQLNVSDEVVIGSAVTGDGIEKLIRILISKAEKGSKIYDEETISNLDFKKIVAEHVRASLFENLKDELPYMINVEVEGFSQNTLYLIVKVSKESHKKIVIGKDAINLRKAISFAKQQTSDIAGDVDIKIFVKVDPNWKNRYLEN